MCLMKARATSSNCHELDALVEQLLHRHMIILLQFLLGEDTRCADVSFMFCEQRTVSDVALTAVYYFGGLT